MSAAVSNPALLPPGALPAKPPAPGPQPGGSGAPTSPQPGAVGGPTRGRAPDRAGNAGSSTGAAGPSFAEVLHQTTAPQPLRFSRHALERVQRRGITLDPATLNRLHDGVHRAATKGSRDSVVLVDGTAFVVSVASRTVLTAVGAEHMREHVFTNIDSAVIA